DLKVPSGTDLEAVFRAMAEAGRRLRQAHREVIADTQIHGLVDLTTSDMTVRAVTRVRPGAHAPTQNEYRRLLKQGLDQNMARAASHPSAVGALTARMFGLLGLSNALPGLDPCKAIPCSVAPLSASPYTENPGLVRRATECHFMLLSVTAGLGGARRVLGWYL